MSWVCALFSSPGSPGLSHKPWITWGQSHPLAHLGSVPCPDWCLGSAPSLRKRLSMSESSHTESDSSPPLTVRRRCSGLLDMPRFAISAEDEGATLKRPQSEGMLLSTVQAREGLPVPIPEQPVEHELPLEGDAGATTPSMATGSATTLAGTCLLWGCPGPQGGCGALQRLTL